MMNSNVKRIVVWTALAMVAGTGTASARVVDKFTSRGKSAAVVCSHTEQIECPFGFFGTIQTDVFVSGDEFTSRSSSSGTEENNNVFVTLIQFNTCTQEFTAAFGSLPDAFSQQSLQSAELQGVVPLKDFETEDPAGALSVDLSFEGFGDTVRDKFRDHFQFETPDGTTIMFVSRSDGKRRSATVSGTLALDGTPLTCTLVDGTLTDVNSGSRTLEHF
jgi:hypothetical protein